MHPYRFNLLDSEFSLTIRLVVKISGNNRLLYLIGGQHFIKRKLKTYRKFIYSSFLTAHKLNWALIELFHGVVEFM